MNHFFALGGQSIGASASASVLPVNIQDWFPLGLTGLISLQCKGLSGVFSNTTVQKHQFFSIPKSIHDYWKNHIFDHMDLCWQSNISAFFFFFNMLSMLVIALLPKNKHLLTSWLQSPSAVIWGPQENETCHCCHCFPIYLPWNDGTRCHDLHFLNVKSSIYDSWKNHSFDSMDFCQQNDVFAF